jgi:hypothetical protein
MTGTMRSWVEFDGLSDRQLAILRAEANDWLVAKADDLPEERDEADGEAKREAQEVAALGRMVSGLWLGKILMPDPIARELIARTIGETRHLDELKEEYDRELGEHEAWVALLGHFDAGPEAGGTESGDEEDRGAAEADPVGEGGPKPAAQKWIELADKVSDDQLRIVRNEVTGMLAGRTDDLPILSKQEDHERQFSEIAALARLALWLDRGELDVSDRLVQEMVRRLMEGSIDLNEYEELRERYEAGMAEQGALLAFAGLFPEGLATGSGDQGDA